MFIGRGVEHEEPPRKAWLAREGDKPLAIKRGIESKLPRESFDPLRLDLSAEPSAHHWAHAGEHEREIDPRGQRKPAGERYFFRRQSIAFCLPPGGVASTKPASSAARQEALFDLRMTAWTVSYELCSAARR